METLNTIMLTALINVLEDNGVLTVEEFREELCREVEKCDAPAPEKEKIRAAVALGGCSGRC